jgi:FHS family L-fucose permease-like MFS transporter
MSKSSQVFPMVIIGILFFIFGFVTWLNGSLIPFLKVLCDLSEFQALFVTFAFYIAYTVMALPMASVLEKTGYKNGMALGLAIMVVGSLVFIPAALTQEFFIFLTALFLLGTGLTILQTASNPYVVFINKAAGVIVPLVFTALILSDMGTLSNELSEIQKSALAEKLITPYIIMAGVLFFLIGLVKFSNIPELEFEKQEHLQNVSILEFPKVVLGAVALFFYVGIEVIAGDTIGLYAQSLGVANATSMTSYTMVFMVLGYFMGVLFIPRFISQQKALLLSALVGIVFIFGIVFSSTESHLIAQVLWGWSGVMTLPDSLTFVALLGFANALVWPTIWPLALDGLGRHTAKGSALLIMAIAGGALLPIVFGSLIDVAGGMQSAYMGAVVCYVFILMYAVKWHKKETWSV